MEQNTRALVAHIIGRLILKKPMVALFDQSRNLDVKFIGPVRPGLINVHCLEQDVHITSRSPGNELLLFQLTRDYHIDLAIEGTKFEGFDEGSEHKFHGRMVEPTLWFFDYETAQHHRYVF